MTKTERIEHAKRQIERKLDDLLGERRIEDRRAFAESIQALIEAIKS